MSCQLFSDFLLLNILIEEKADTKASAMTIKEFPIEDIGIKINTLQKRMKYLRQLGYVELGYMDYNAYTYYITDIGKEALGKTSE